MAGFKSFSEKLTTGLKRFTPQQITIGVIGVVGIAVLASVLVTGMNRSQMAPLFSGISAEDASAITEQLIAANVEYELTSGGTTILIPEEEINAQRIAAAANGLPSDSSSGYSILDGLSSTSTEFQQSTSYKRAIEGELEETISSIRGVTTSSVQLALPEETVFVAEKADATASVFVKTKAGYTLTTEQVNSIVHLVSASIEGMEATNVAVIDANGEVLSAVGQGTTGSISDEASKLEVKTKTSIQNLLDRMLGPGNTTVAVATTISTESADLLTETFERPEDDPAFTESVTVEEYAGGRGGATGVLGPDNIAVPNGDDVDGGYLNESTDRTNAINKVTENRAIPAGAVERQTISVAVDLAAADDITVAEITAMINGAAGVDEARGDLLNVEIVPFDTTAADRAAEALAEAEAEEAAAAQAEMMKQLIIGGAIGLAVLILAVILLFKRKRKVVAEIPAEDYVPIAPVIDYTEPIFHEEVNPLANVRFSNGDPSPVEVVIAEVADASTRHPEKVAEQLRQMMKTKGTTR